jgi:hypothetical protein
MGKSTVYGVFIVPVNQSAAGSLLSTSTTSAFLTIITLESGLWTKSNQTKALTAITNGCHSWIYKLTLAPPSVALRDMADAEEPLMGQSSRDGNGHEVTTQEDTTHDVDLSDVSLLLEKNLRHPGLFVWLLTLSAGISGLLFGCT